MRGHVLGRIWFVTGAVILMLGCKVRPVDLLPSDAAAPDYSQARYWAALPHKQDPADAVPSTSFKDRQQQSKVDVFFLHPTTYTGDRDHNKWNAPIDQALLDQKTDQTSILHQASIFNAAGKIYAPRYRQAHLRAYFDKKNPAAVQSAFELAYQDVRRAFLYYLKHYNQGRAMIIAAHSQGTAHAAQILKEFFDGQPLQDKLVVAYLVGLPVPKSYLSKIPVCEMPSQTGCFCSWRTFKKGYLPKKFPLGDTIAITNPLSWTTDGHHVSRDFNKGGILRNYYEGPIPHLTDARIVQGVLWSRKPKFPGSFLLIMRNYHIGDYNLFWVNVRENAVLRVQTYLEK